MMNPTLNHLVPAKAVGPTLDRSSIAGTLPEVWFALSACACGIAGGLEAGNARPTIGAVLWLFTAVTAFVIAALGLRRERESARRDGLTGLVGRTGFISDVNHEINRSARYKRPMTVAFIDLDHFKALNDRFGHRTGDRALEMAASTMRTALRDIDTLARLGGDEFAVLLPETRESGARIALARLKTTVDQAFADAGWPVTCSVGAVTCNLPPVSAEAVLHRADELMYRAKRAGGTQPCHEVDLAMAA